MSPSGTSPLTVRLLGTFEARLRDLPLRSLRTRRGEWLLALLILRHPAPVDRAWMAGLLWPDSAEARALNSLRVTLSDLRSALGSEGKRLHAPTPQTLGLDLAGATVDLRDFDAAVARGDEPALERAVALYRGPLLDGCGEPWVLPEREPRHQAYLRALETLAARGRERGDPRAAERWLRLCVAADPLRESAYRELMCLLAEEGSQAAALAIYRDLRLLLHREIGAAPDPETRALYEQIRSGAPCGREGVRGRGSEGANERPATSARNADLPRSPRRPAAPSPPRPLTPSPSEARGEATRHNLPHPVTRFIGREREIAEIRRLYDETRLLTVTGAGGVGKTRFALQAAWEIAGEDAERCGCDGVWLVELAPLADAAFLPQAVAMALGIREEPGTPLLGTLMAFLQERRPLIVLDNCEHLIGACAAFADALLHGAPGVRILATSREPLNIAGEVTYRLPSLTAPDPACLPALPEALARYEAVRLFVDRARAVAPGFDLTPDNAPAVAAVCSRLDGIALAVELAAARVKVLPLAVIQERLGDRFRLLTGGSRGAPPRHQTLLAAIDWSYDLLTDPEQALLRRLSVFAGGATLAAVEGACGADLDLLTRLVDKSLVDADTRGEEARYRLLETIRQYAAGKLEDAGETAVFRARHQEWFTRFAREALPGFPPRERGRWLDRLEREHDNLRAALEWAMATGDAEAGFAVADALAPLWTVRGHASEGCERLGRLLALPEAAAPSRARCRALRIMGELTWQLQDLPAMRAAYMEMREIADTIGDTACRAHALSGFALWMLNDGESIEKARALLWESLTLFRQVPDPVGTAVALERLGRELSGEDPAAARSLLGESLEILDGVGGEDRIWTQEGLAWLARWEGDHGTARSLYEENLATSQELGYYLGIWWSQLRLIDLDAAEGKHAAARERMEAMLAWERASGSRGNVAILLKRLGEVARQQGDDRAAVSYYEECLVFRRTLRSRRDLSPLLADLGELLWRRGDRARAEVLLTESLELRREEGEPREIAKTLRVMGGLAEASGDHERAVRFHAEADALSGSA